MELLSNNFDLNRLFHGIADHHADKVLAHVVLNKDLGRKQGRRKLGSNSSL
jgi:hypothetical protein